jgi:hypothetical protein
MLHPTQTGGNFRRIGLFRSIYLVFINDPDGCPLESESLSFKMSGRPCNESGPGDGGSDNNEILSEKAHERIESWSQIRKAFRALCREESIASSGDEDGCTITLV